MKTKQHTIEWILGHGWEKEEIKKIPRLNKNENQHSKIDKTQ